MIFVKVEVDSYLAIIREYNNFWLFKWSHLGPHELLWNDILEQREIS